MPNTPYLTRASLVAELDALLDEDITCLEFHTRVHQLVDRAKVPFRQQTSNSTVALVRRTLLSASNGLTYREISKASGLEIAAIKTAVKELSEKYGDDLIIEPHPTFKGMYGKPPHRVLLLPDKLIIGKLTKLRERGRSVRVTAVAKAIHEDEEEAVDLMRKAGFTVRNGVGKPIDFRNQHSTSSDSFEADFTPQQPGGAS